MAGVDTYVEESPSVAHVRQKFQQLNISEEQGVEHYAIYQKSIDQEKFSEYILKLR